MRTRTIIANVLLSLGYAALCIGVTIGVMIVVERVPPKEPVQPPFPPEEDLRAVEVAPTVISSAMVQCFPVLTEDARQAAWDRCSREGGNVSTGYTFVECWNHEPYDQEDDPESFLRWEYTVKQALSDDAKKAAELGIAP